MNASLKELEGKVLQLSPSERAQLIGTLIASLEGEMQGSAEEIAAAWDTEIERRIEEMEAGRMDFVDADETLRALRAHAAQRRAGWSGTSLHIPSFHHQSFHSRRFRP